MKNLLRRIEKLEHAAGGNEEDNIQVVIMDAGQKLPADLNQFQGTDSKLSRSGGISVIDLGGSLKPVAGTDHR